MPYFEIVDGPNQGMAVPLAGEMTLGRSPENALCLPDSRASRRHALVRPEGEDFVLVDLGSANGTYVNRKNLPKETPHRLREGDEVVIGQSWLVYHAGSRVQTRQPPAGARPVAGGDPGEGSNLNVRVTGEDGPAAPAVNASLDASVSMLEVRDEERGSEKGLLEAIERLQAMVKVSAALGGLTRRGEVLDRIMDSIFDIFPQADRAFIMLRGAEAGEMEPVVARDRRAANGAEGEFAVSRTIIRTVTEERKSILSSDAQSDDRFGVQQSIVDLSIRSMMCAPFIWQDEILGLISVDTTQSMKTFDSDDLAMLTGIAAQAAIAIKNSDLYNAVEEETQKRTMLSRYISPDVVEGVLDGMIPLELGGEKKRGTVFFCDIVGFTAMSETMTAVEVIDKLNRYFHITTEVVARNRGTLHKFGGDMIMAFWSVLLADPEAEINAIRTSLEMQIAVWSFDLDLELEGQQPIYLGIGCNTGEFAGGNIGGEMIEYTIIGDNVNLGQRIESLAGRWQVFVSEATYLPAKDACIAVRLPPARVKGKSEPIAIYSIRGIRTGEGELLLDVPVHLLAPDGRRLGRGLLTGLYGEGPDAEFALHTDARVEEGASLTLQLDVPEVAREFRIDGTACRLETAPHDGQATYTRLRLCDARADEELLAFFRPGALLESRRKWEEMQRH